MASNPAGTADDMDTAGVASEGNIVGTPTHGGEYVQYNVFGNLFEVPQKYTHPFRPVGRGAYGIVWLVMQFPHSVSSGAHQMLLCVRPKPRV